MPMRVGLVRVIVRALTLSVAVALLVASASAQEVFPSRPIQIVVPLPPGGAADLHARPLAEVLQRILKQPVVVVNKPGAGSAVGTQFVANARADGYTLLVAMPGFFIIPQVDALFGRAPKFTVEQFTPLARLSADPVVLVVHPARPWKSVGDLVAEAKRRPVDITYGSAGLYTGIHLPMEIFAAAAEIKLRHVPFNGAGPAVTALLGGHVDAMVSGAGPVLAHIKSGSLRALAVFGNRRLTMLPEVLTLKELGYDVEYYLGVGVVVRKETPPAAIQVLHDGIKQAVKAPEFEAAMAKLGTSLAYLGADEYLAVWQKDARIIAETLQRVGKITE